ncbi:MAG: DUF3105 domain-containing protein [Actinomycetota bacterium]
MGKRSGGPSGQEKQELRRQRLEARRAAKMAALERQRKQQRREQLVRYLIVSSVIVSLVWVIFLRNQTPSEIDGHPISQFSTAGVNDHTTDPVQYETVPGVSGAHSPGSLPCGVYNAEVPEPSQVHMLEHGAVGINFQPTLDPETIEQIEDVVRDAGENVFSAPYEGLPQPISVTSWSRMMKLDEFDRAAVEEYIDIFAGKGPESGQTCPNEEDSPFEIAPSPSAVPSPSPTEEAGGKKNSKD